MIFLILLRKHHACFQMSWLSALVYLFDYYCVRLCAHSLMFAAFAPFQEIEYAIFFVTKCLTNRFHVAVRLFSNRSQMTSKCGKNKKVIAECVTDVLTTF